MESKYTESHKRSYIKRHDKELYRSRVYYEENKAAISQRRKIQYKQKKERNIQEAERAIIPSETEIGPPLSDEAAYILFLEQCTQKIWNRKSVAIIEAIGTRSGPGIFQRKQFKNYVYILLGQFAKLTDEEYKNKVGKLYRGFLGSLYNETNINFRDIEKKYIMQLHESLGAALL